MEIERKFLIKKKPDNLSDFPSVLIEQGYLCTTPVVRVRRQDDRFILTYKGEGLLSHEEFNLPLTEESYAHLIQKADGRIITKTRYLIPYGKYTIELDLFAGDLAPLELAEVEFPSEKEAHAFQAPDWFDKDVTMDSRYHNSTMSKA